MRRKNDIYCALRRETQRLFRPYETETIFRQKKYDLNKKAEEEKMKQQRERNIVENIIDRLQIATAAHKIDYNFKSVINIAEIFGERDQSKEIFPGVTTNKVLLLLSSVYIIEIVISTITIMQWSNIQFHRPGFTRVTE